MDELKKYPKKRKIKLEFLAKEAGYANRQSLARAFQSVAKVSPSCFMEKLQTQTLEESE